MTNGNTYYVINKSGNNFQLSNSQGGSAVGLSASADQESAESHSLGGVNATATVTMSGDAIASVTINEVGTLYDGNSLPSLTLSEDVGASAATLQVFCGRSINSISIGSRGSGYTSAPTVTITASDSDTTGSGGAATSTIGYPIDLSLIHI